MHRAIAAFRGLLAALERRYAICQGFKLAAHGGRRIGKPLRKLGKRRGARVGARARLARSGKRLLVAAAERNHGLGKRLKLGLERREAVGKRGVAGTDGRRGARGRLEPGEATCDLFENFGIGARRRGTRGKLAQVKLEAGKARVERAHAVVAADDEARNAEHREHDAQPRRRRAEQRHARSAPPRRRRFGRARRGIGGCAGSIRR